MLVIRSADANETAAAWRLAIEHTGGPVALVLTRQNLPVLDLQQFPHIPSGVRAGEYVLANTPGNQTPQIILVATGSEVHLALAARQELNKRGVPSRVVSLPCWNLFEAQPDDYRRAVLPPEVPLLAIEAGIPLGWRPYVGPGNAVVGVEHFGASAPGPVLLREYGLSIEAVTRQALDALGKH